MGARPQGRVLIVAGSDPSGGAGIQADIKTVTKLGGYAAAAISALTIQNTLGVSDVMVPPSAFVGAQMRAVLEDIGADCIKTGMLPTAEAVSLVAEIVQQEAYTGALVVDPVLVATSGDALAEDGVAEALKSELIAIASLVTPNIPEAEVLTGTRINSLDDMQHAASLLLETGTRAVLLKGGHLRGEKLVDLLITANGATHTFESERINTQNTHGTGCTMASAIAALLAQGEGLVPAVEKAHAFVRAAIKAAPNFGKGNGPLGHAQVESE